MSGQGGGGVKLVVFDLGRVLVRICDDWMHACSTAGIELATKNLGPQDIMKLRDLVHQVEIHTIDFPRFAKEAGAILGATSDQIYTASAAFVVGLYEGVPELLSDLSAAGVKSACLSNTNEHHWGLLSDKSHPAFFPLSSLNHQFASHLIRARKPDDAIYAHLERVAQARGPEILFFDDVEENVRAARKRAWLAEWIDPERNDPLTQIREGLKTHRVL
jgi:FMN phosphatase YigB (HAD superfamily)